MATLLNVENVENEPKRSVSFVTGRWNFGTKTDCLSPSNFIKYTHRGTNSTCIALGWVRYRGHTQTKSTAFFCQLFTNFEIISQTENADIKGLPTNLFQCIIRLSLGGSRWKVLAPFCALWARYGFYLYGHACVWPFLPFTSAISGMPFQLGHTYLVLSKDSAA